MRLNGKREMQRVEGAAERQVAYAGLSKQEKLAKLDKRLGRDVGATKERAKLK